MENIYLNKEDLHQDLQTITSTAEGQRFFLHHLRSLGVGRPIDPDNIQEIIQKNIGETLLDTLAQAVPQVCIRLMAQLKNI